MKWMYFYCFKAVKNYKNIFKLIYMTKIKRFNSHSYFYCIDQRINLLVIIINLSRVPFIVKEG